MPIVLHANFPHASCPPCQLFSMPIVRMPIVRPPIIKITHREETKETYVKCGTSLNLLFYKVARLY